MQINKFRLHAYTQRMRDPLAMHLWDVFAAPSSFRFLSRDFKLYTAVDAPAGGYIHRAVEMNLAWPIGRWKSPGAVYEAKNNFQPAGTD